MALATVLKYWEFNTESNRAALVTAHYGYDFKTDDKGVEHYEVGPETITCDALSEPIVTVGSELNEAVDQDAALKAEKEKYNSKRIEIKKKQFCEIISDAFVTVVHNIRASAKIFPKTAFLKGI